MGLFEALNLKPPRAGLARSTAGGPADAAGAAGAAAGTAGAAAATPAAAADPLDAGLGARIDAISALLDRIHDDAAAKPLRDALQTIVDGRTKAGAMVAGKSRTAAYRALLDSAAALKPKADAAARRAEAVERREAARKEVDVTLGQVTALVLGGVIDDGLRDAVNAELKKQQAAFAKAEKIADHAAAEKALRALLPGAQALLARAERAKAVTDWAGEKWQPQRAHSGAAVAALDAGPARALLETRLATLDGDAKARIAAADRAGLEALLAPLVRVQAVATAVGAAARGVDAQIASVQTQVSAMGAQAPRALVDALAALRTRRANEFGSGANEDAVEASVASVAAEAKALVEQADAAVRQLAAKRKFEVEIATLQPQVDAASAVVRDKPHVPTAAARSAFVAARTAVNNAVAAADWVRAAAALPALRATSTAVKKAAADELAYRAAFAPLQGKLLGARAALASPGLPSEPTAALEAAEATHRAALNARDWVAAKAALAALSAATQKALDAVDDGRKFYDEFAPLQASFDAAVGLLRTPQVFTDTTLSGLAGSFSVLRKGMTDKIAGADWRPARRMLPDVDQAARNLVVAERRYSAAIGPYTAAKAAVTPKDAQADRLAGGKAAALVAPVKAWKAARTAVFEAERDGDFARATALLAAWGQACDAVLAAQTAEVQAKAEFELVFNAIADHAEARQLAAGAPPALQADAKTFLAADAAVEKARQAANWSAAMAATTPLEEATKKLIAAKVAFNGAARPADLQAIADKLKALEPRTARAADPAPGPYLARLQKTVTDRLAQIGTAQAAPDLAAAEASLAQLLADLAAMEEGRRKHDAFVAASSAARNGEVAKARALALAPAALAAERDAALAAAEREIEALGNDGRFAEAQAAIARWEQQARSWPESQAAYAEVHGGKVPDVAKLEALAKKPGGDAVLDAIILKLPASTPAKVLSAALKARYGFEIKRFDTRRAEETDTKGMKGKDPERADPELVKIYALMAQIPSARIKGKIKQMIAFDTDDNAGTYYGGSMKSIYLHAGRLDDASGDIQDFGGDDIVPEGEQVADECKPRPGAKPVPVANATLLHEAAHAEDAGAGFMNTNKSKSSFGGWRDESPESIAPRAAAHLGFDEDYILKMLQDVACRAPDRVPKPPKGVSAPDWEKRRQAAVRWCQAIRASAKCWWKPTVCKEVSIGGRVYFESYDDGRWASYDYAARSQGISGYQFRAAPEWFAELYSAHFSGALKPSHPAMAWLKDFKPPQP